MSLKYSLTENLLTAQADDYNARPQDVKSHDLESIIAQMLERKHRNPCRHSRGTHQFF